MLNPWHRVNKLLPSGINIQGSSSKENVLNFKCIPFKAHHKNFKKNSIQTIEIVS